MKRILLLLPLLLSSAALAQDAPKPKARVLILGDSISMGYMPFVKEMLAEDTDVIRPRLNCLGTKNGVAKLDEWLALEGGKWTVIHFNFGLHDLKHETADGKPSEAETDPRQSEPEAYEKNLRDITTRLKATGAKLVFATTTPVPPGCTKPLRKPEYAKQYNDIALRIMKEHGVAINDLHAFCLPRLENLQRPANVHFTPAGSKALASEVVRHIRDAKNAKAAKPANAAAGKAPAKPAANGPKWTRVYPDFPPALAFHADLVCATYGERKVTLDLYQPKAKGPHPGIVIIHGGGWWKGDIETDKPLAERLALKGFVVALIEYRLSGEAIYPAALEDCRAAVRFLRENAATYDVDPAKIGVTGGSAGGHLSGLLAMTGDASNPAKPHVQACIVMAATQDMVAAYSEKPSDAVTQFLGGTGKEKPDLYREASPITHVSKHSPPTIYIEGEKDTLKIGRPEMQEKLRALGIETAIHTLKDGPHPFWMSQPWLDQTSEISIEFFTRVLK
jgi:acetyl esterase/lipase